MRKGTCLIEGCEKPGTRRGLCHAHATRGPDAVPMRNRRPKYDQCIAPGCEAVPWAHGMCPKHRRRWDRRGTLDEPELRPSPVERFLSYVDLTGPAPPLRPDLGPCWVWMASVNRYGYPVFWCDGRQVRAHRWSYEHRHGPFPDGLEPDHLCHTVDMDCPGGDGCLHRRCVNPAHLEAVTAAENSRRAVARRRAAGLPARARRS